MGKHVDCHTVSTLHRAKSRVCKFCSGNDATTLNPNQEELYSHFFALSLEKAKTQALASKNILLIKEVRAIFRQVRRQPCVMCEFYFFGPIFPSHIDRPQTKQ